MTVQKKKITDEAIERGERRWKLELRVKEAMRARGEEPPDMDEMSDEEVAALEALAAPEKGGTS